MVFDWALQFSRDFGGFPRIFREPDLERIFAPTIMDPDSFTTSTLAYSSILAVCLARMSHLVLMN